MRKRILTVITVLTLIWLITIPANAGLYANYTAFGRTNIDVVVPAVAKFPDVGRGYYSGAYHAEDICEQICMPVTGKHFWKRAFQPTNAYRGWNESTAYIADSWYSGPSNISWNYANADSNWNNNLTAVLVCSTNGVTVDYVAIQGYDILGEAPPAEYSVRILNTDIFTNQTINPSNISVYYNDGLEYLWYNETGTDGDIDTGDTSWQGQNIRVCSAATGYPEICNNNFIPETEDSVIIWQKLVPSQMSFPTPTILPNVSVNITSTNLTEPFKLPNFTLVNKTEFRDQITNNSIIGNYTYAITGFMDELGEAINQTVQDSIEFIDVPMDFLIDIQMSAHNLYLSLFLPLIPFSYLPLLVTSMVVAVIPWQIQSLISLGLLIDLFYLMVRGSGGS